MPTDTYESHLRRGHEAARAAMANPDYSSQKREQMANEARAAGVAEAQRVAADMLSSSRNRVKRAADALTAAEDIAGDSMNWTKVLALQTIIGAEVRMARDWNAVDGLVERYGRDAEALKVLGTSGTLALSERIHAPMDALAARPQNIATFERVVGERAQALEPASLQKARADYDTAATAAREVERDVRAVNRSWGPNGTPMERGVFDGVLGENQGVFAGGPGNVTYRVKGSPETYSTAAEMFAAAEAVPAGGGVNGGGE